MRISDSLMEMSYSIWVVITRCFKLVAYERQKFLSHSFGAQAIQDQGTVDLVSGKDLFPLWTNTIPL